MPHLNETGCSVELSRRIVSEYKEMPGLILTAPQGSRLWGADTATVLRLLNHLTRTGFLVRRGKMYLRLSTR